MSKAKLKTISGKLKKASKAHAGQAKQIDGIIKSTALKKKTSCWTGYTNIVDGKPQFKKKGKRTVPDCKPIKGKKK